MAGPCIAVLLKYVDLRPSTDPLTGVVTHDPYGGLSASDQCALELALQLGESQGLGVRALSAGGPASDAVLRLALASGVREVRRIEQDPDAASGDVAAVLAGHVTDARYVLCGDYSLDRGTGAVPAFVAGHMGFAQVLGATSVQWTDGALQIERRLDRGRREEVVVRAPAVVSVEGGLPPLRRSPLPLVLSSAGAEIPMVPGSPVPPEAGRTTAFRPRPRVLDGPDAHLPTRQRLLTLSGALTVFDPPRVVVATPADAADELLQFLSARGYLEPTDS